MAMRVVALRLDDETIRRVLEASRLEDCTPSEWMRQAILVCLDDEVAGETVENPKVTIN